MKKKVTFPFKHEKLSESDIRLYTRVPALVCSGGVITYVIIFTLGGILHPTINYILLGASIAMMVGPLIFWHFIFVKPKNKEIIIDQENGVLKLIRTALWLKNDVVKKVFIKEIQDFNREMKNFKGGGGTSKITTYKVWLHMNEEWKWKLLATESQDDADQLVKWLEIHLKPIL
ncbi:MAG: hypothetical protein ACFFCS_27925 [Candidatus Hodarchaeota archaeon]